MELVLTNRRIASDEALRIGLVHRVVPAEELLSHAERLAERLASLSPKALVAAKSAVVDGMDLPLSEGLALERRLGLRLMAETV